MPDRLVLLTTDIVDSTELNAQLGDGVMGPLWEAHDRLARELARKWSGREIGRSDGFLLLFADVPSALRFAAGYHAGLLSLNERLKARVGIHIGVANLRENSAFDRDQGATRFDVDGVALPLTARIMSLAQGGQTLLSAGAAHAAKGGTGLECHGYWRLKGIEEPVELYEMLGPHAPGSPPPDSSKAYSVVRVRGRWVPRRDLRNSLPIERNEFVGRTSALHNLARRFDNGARLVSVLGVGGTGKTRLAVRFGWTWLGDFPGGVWFCDISQARGVDGIVQALAEGLQLPLGQSEPVLQIGRALSGRGSCLVILDNFEQVSRHAEATLGYWLGHTSDARFIVTTREVLGITGEEILALPPLDVEEGVELFVKRALAVRSDFIDNAAERAIVRQVTDLLDRLPLAIELAAARTLTMPTSTVLRHMGQRFRLLSARGGRQDRQSTLRKAFDWSWDLLDDVDKSALAQLSVFEGGFTSASAEAIVDLSFLEDVPWIADVLQSLVEKSLLLVRGSDRFELLGTVQEYARDHLSSTDRFPHSGPLAFAAVQARHYRFFAGMNEREAVSGGCIEIGNLEVACRRATLHSDAKAAANALVGAWAALKLRGPFRVALELADFAASIAAIQSSEKASIEWVAGSALYSMGRSPDARQRLAAALEAALAAGDLAKQSRVLCTLGELLTNAGEGEAALGMLDQSHAMALSLNDPVLRYKSLNALGALANFQARIDDARAHYEDALRLADELADLRWQGGLLNNLAVLLHGQGRLDAARVHYESAIARARLSSDRRWEGNALCNLGLLRHERGEHEQARACLEGALAAARELGHPRLESIVLSNLGIVAADQGDVDPAYAFHARAIEGAQALGDRRSEGTFRTYMGRLQIKVGRWSEAQECLTTGERLLAETGDGMSLGVLLCTLAQAQFGGGHAALAADTLRRAELLAGRVGAEAGSELGKAVADCRQLLR